MGNLVYQTYLCPSVQRGSPAHWLVLHCRLSVLSHRSKASLKWIARPMHETSYLGFLMSIHMPGRYCYSFLAEPFFAVICTPPTSRQSSLEQLLSGKALLEIDEASLSGRVLPAIDIFGHAFIEYLLWSIYLRGYILHTHLSGVSSVLLWQGVLLHENYWCFSTWDLHALIFSRLVQHTHSS